MLAPPWVAVPPTSYGGTELVLDVLCRGLQDRGHEVVLFTVADSTCAVRKKWLFEHPDPDRMGAAVLELRHAAAGYDAFVDCDIVHDHTLAGLFLGRGRPSMPIVTTNHGPFNDDLSDLYGRAGLPLIAISHDQARRAPEHIEVSTVIHHGLDTTRYRFDPDGGDYLLSLGRMSPDKGIDVAIDVARRAGLRLLIAAKMREPAEQRYFAEVIEPMLGGGAEYVGEVGHRDKISLLGGAMALLNPIQWPEPFGLVMTEALACGTPVVATPSGAAPEIVQPGVTGYLGENSADLVAGVRKAAGLDRRRCRRSVEQYFSMERMAADHEAFYRSVLAEGPPVAGGKNRPSTDLVSVAS
jgi:glycosyltransferase involved in cell wall biosynthesis